MFYIKQNDTSPALQATLQRSDGTAVNLVGATVRFHMAEDDTTTAVVDAAAELVTAASGIVRYLWAVGDTADPGTYRAEFEVTYSDGTVETFPNDSYLKVKVTPELA